MTPGTRTWKRHTKPQKTVCVSLDEDVADALEARSWESSKREVVHEALRAYLGVKTDKQEGGHAGVPRDVQQGV